MLGRQHSGHLFHVLGRLVLHDVHGVVEGDDADEAVFRIHDRKRQKVILGEHLRDLLLIVERVDGDDVLLHDGFDGRLVVLTQKQILDRDQTDQLVSARNVAGVNGLLVDAGTADAEDGLLHRHVRPQGNIFRRHDRAGGILGIAENLVDLLAHLRLRLRQDPLHHVGGHFLDDIDGVIDVQLVNDLFQLRVREAADQQLLKLRLHLDERLRRQLLRQQPEQQRQARFVDVLEHGGDVCGVHCVEQIPQRVIPLLIQKLEKGIAQGKFQFCHEPFLLNRF